MHDNGIWDGVVARPVVEALNFMISDDRAVAAFRLRIAGSPLLVGA